MKRLVIDRLELDLRGLSPASAEETARLLGPALARALAHGSLTARSTKRLDAGRIDHATRAQPQPIAARVAEHIARHVGQRSERGRGK
jgi:hypothetical protein